MNDFASVVALDRYQALARDLGLPVIASKALPVWLALRSTGAGWP
jgi:hypothetical protein